jgi:PBSX family phage terminase large subunit
VWDDQNRYILLNCGRRAGKTYFSALKLIDFSAKNKNKICWYIAPTYKQAKQIMWEMLKNLVPWPSILKTNATELYIQLKNGSKIELKGADNPDSLRGVRIDLAIFDEVAFMDNWSQVWKVIRPTLMDSQADCYFISTPNGFNHYKDMYDQAKIKPDWSSYKFTTWDNPYIPKKELEQAKVEMDENSYAQEIMAEFRKMKGLIYTSFDRQIHLGDVPPLTQTWTYGRSLDFGFSHKTALLYFAVNDTGSKIVCYDGFYKQGVLIDELAEVAKTKRGNKQMAISVADSAQPLLIEELRRKGVYFDAVEKGADSVRSGITKVKEKLKVRADTGKPTLLINKELTWLADEFETYRWMENKADGYIKEKPLKRNDDALDALRYYIMSYQPTSTNQYLTINKTNKNWQIGT